MPERISVGDITVARKEFKRGLIKGVELINNQSIDIPVMVMNGVDEGPTLLLMSTQHGTEIQGIEVIRRLMREILSARNLRGSVIGIPVGNPLAFMHYQYVSWVDNQDVGNVRADNPNGGATERLAYLLWAEAWSRADLIVNLHCNTRPDSLIFQMINVGNLDTKDKLVKMAEAIGITTIVSDRAIGEDAPPTLGNLASRKGIPVVLVELIDGRWISEPSTSAGIRGILNIMKTFNMIDGDSEPQTGFPIIKGVNRSAGQIRAGRGGLVRFFKKPGELIKKGELFAEVYDLYGDVLEQVKMPVDGYVWATPCTGNVMAVVPGGNIGYAFTHEEK